MSRYEKLAAMATHLHALLLTVTFLGAVHGNFTTPAHLTRAEIDCMDECQFLEENQTLIIIDITNPKTAVKGVAYYTTPIRMKDPATRTVASFASSFTFREEPKNYNASPAVTLEQMKQWAIGDGFTFMMTNSSSWKGDAAGRLGIFASNNAVNPKIVAVEFDSYANPDTDPQYGNSSYSQKAKEFEHVSLDVGTPISECYNLTQPLNISFFQRAVIRAWVEYDGVAKKLEVRISNTSSRPVDPILACDYDLYHVVDEKMWVGFSGSIGDSWAVYYIYNWTFTSFGIDTEFSEDGSVNVGLVVGLSAGGVFLLVLGIWVGVCVCLRRRRSQQESWDKEGLLDMSAMPEFISYKHLSAATKQFSDECKLGQGGFGSVYRGVLPKTGQDVAVKKVSSDSRQGEREFLAEVRIISQLRHRNVVELIGFCRDRGKFLLVYELLPRGSLEQALFKTPEEALPWPLRWKIVSGTAAALHYLHEGWRQQVIHRDVKSSNIMLDEEWNAKLGDFGLARLVDHSKHAATTLVAGTYGYMAPEAVGGRFTDKTDVFAFGAVVLEVACGRRPYDGKVRNAEDMILVEKVWRHWKDGALLDMADERLHGQFDPDEMCTVLKLGLLCSHPEAASRPSMRQVVQVLAGEADVPDVSEAMPAASLAADMPNISIDDLLNSSGSGSKSRSGRGKQPASIALTSMSSSIGRHSLGRKLDPR